MTGIYYSADLAGWVVAVGFTFPDTKEDEWEMVGNCKTFAEAVDLLFSALTERVKAEGGTASNFLRSGKLEERLQTARLERMLEPVVESPKKRKKRKGDK